MTAQTEPAVLSAELASKWSPTNGIDSHLYRKFNDSIKAIATKEVICKSSAAEATDRARIAELEETVQKLRARLHDANDEIFHLEKEMGRNP